MNKTEIEAQIAEETGINKKLVSEVLQSLQAVATRSLQRGEAVRLTGFLTLAVKERAARTGNNPKTGEQIEIASRSRVMLRVGKDLDAAVNA